MAIPRAAKRPCDDSTMSNGPLSREITLKPRPKPGRKPMADQNDSSDKRKTQNRIAQRHFRDRRAQKCNDLELENTQLKEAHRLEMSALREQLMQRDAHIAALLAEKVDAGAERARVDSECNQLRERNVVLQRELGTFYILIYPMRPILTILSRCRQAPPCQCTCFSPSGMSGTANHFLKSIIFTLPQRPALTSNYVSSVHQILTPPSDNNDPHDEYEVDFTNIYATRKPSAFSSGLGTDEHCGFCSDVENCICRQQEELNNKTLPSLPPIDSSRATIQIKPHSDVSTPSFLEARTEASGPGTCDMCLADPEKARQCRELAEVAFKESEAASTQDAASKSTGTVTLRRLKQLDPPKHTERTSCSDFFQQAQQRNVRLRRDDYQQIKHVYRVDGRSEHSPYMEMDTRDAAHALAALSRQDTRSGLDRQV
jgi:hypothetical protein